MSSIAEPRNAGDLEAFLASEQAAQAHAHRQANPLATTHGQPSVQQALAALPSMREAGTHPSFRATRAMPGAANASSWAGKVNPVTGRPFASYQEWAAVAMPDAFRNSRLGQGRIEAPANPVVVQDRISSARGWERLNRPQMSQQELLDLGDKVLQLMPHLMPGGD